jgi:parallel beta-helix repeat protein
MTKHSGGLFRDERDDQRFTDDEFQWTWGVGHHDFGDHNHDGHHDHGQHVLHVGADEQFTTIQSAVDAAQNGDLILVDAGTYTEQVTITGKDLTIKGQGDATHIVAPATLSANIDDTGSGTPSENAVIGVVGGHVDISDVLVDGAGQANHVATTIGAADFDGIYFFNASGSVHDVTVTGIHDPYNLDGSLSGLQRGNGVFVANRDGVDRTVEISDSTIKDFQKTGIVFSGDGATADVHNNTVTGNGLQPIIAQNGIQISFGATGSVEHNNVGNLGFGPDSFSSTGILVAESDNVKVDDNNVSMVGDSQDAGIAFIDADNPTADNNTVSATYAIYQLGEFTHALDQEHNKFDGSSVAIGFYPTTDGQSFHFTGSSGNDDIEGYNGNDVLNGAKGDDFLVGDSSHLGFGTGTGNDVFVFDKNSGNDTIADFGQTTGDRDLIDVSDYHFKNFAQCCPRFPMTVRAMRSFT